MKHADKRLAQIRALNDTFRQSLAGGRVTITRGVADLSDSDQAVILGKVRLFTSFTPDNDPHGERDFGAFEHAGVRYFWKIDYYDAACAFGSENPADPKVTTRVMTIMRADEY